MKETAPAFSIISSKSTKNSAIPEHELEYYNTVAHQLAPATHEFRKRVGIEMVEWARRDPNAFRVSQFLNARGVTRRVWYAWKDRDEFLADCHETTMSMLAERREIGALKRELDPQIVRLSMPLYDPEWKEVEEWRAKLGEKQADGGTKIVIMEKYGEKND